MVKESSQADGLSVSDSGSGITDEQKKAVFSTPSPAPPLKKSKVEIKQEIIEISTPRTAMKFKRAANEKILMNSKSAEEVKLLLLQKELEIKV